MYQLKTKQNDEDVLKFLETIDDEQKRSDCLELVDVISEITGEPAKMWGSAMVGFGTYHYKYESGHEGDYFITGFAPRKANITLYIMQGFAEYGDVLNNLGKFKKSGGSCLQIKKLSDIDLQLLKKLIDSSVKYMKKKYPKK